MCFFYALSQTAQRLKNRYQLKFEFEFEFEAEYARAFHEPKYYVSGFDYPQMPVITNQKPDTIQTYTWGLIPFWVKSPADAAVIRSKTLNARSDTVLTKPSYRNAIRRKRCLVPADGFYEWQTMGGKKYPYYIRLKDRDIFSMAGLWDEWSNASTGEVLKTFSILTTEANPLMETIHNTKKRMPVILPKEKEWEWLQNDMAPEEILALAKPLNEELMEAYTISKLITSRNSDRNVPAIQEAYDYPELKRGL